MKTENAADKPVATPEVKPLVKAIAAKPAVKPVAAKKPASIVAAVKAAPKTAARVATKAAVKAAPKAAVKAAPKAAVKPAPKAAVKPALKATVKRPATPAVKSASSQKRIAPKSEVKAVSPIVRDSFTMTAADQELLKKCKRDAVTSGRDSTKKSEIVRAALRHFASLAASTQLMELNGLDPVKTGRPKKK